jgi:hypothetical protein
MKESIVNNVITSAMFGLLFIGGITVLVKAYNATKNIEHSFEFVVKEDDEDIFI